jgi:hypothetical protein
MNYDLTRLHDKLTDAFIEYQHRLDLPMPFPTVTPEVMQHKYLNDPIFHARVATLVAGVIDIVTDWVDLEKKDE